MEHFYQRIYGSFDFADIYNDAVTRAVGDGLFVEVGVGLGRSLAFLAVEALNKNPAAKVVGVDMFQGFGYTERERVEWGGIGPLEHFPAVLNHLCSVLDSVALLGLPSVRAAEDFADGSCDLVFIDAAHDYANVKADLAAWWPKVKKGGVFAGHDYAEIHGHPGVRQAADEFAAENGLALGVWTTSWRILKVV